MLWRHAQPQIAQPHLSSDLEPHLYQQCPYSLPLPDIFHHLIKGSQVSEPQLISLSVSNIRGRERSNLCQLPYRPRSHGSTRD